MQVERIWEFLRRLTPSTKNCPLTELERLEMCGIDMPCSADIQARLRAELRKDGSTQGTAMPFRYFFAPLDPCSSTATPSMKIGEDRTRFAGPDLGMDRPRPATDHGARLQ
jgi:hypothetical protein